MQIIGIASLSYAASLVAGILFWAWQNSRQHLYLVRGLPPALLGRFPSVTKADQRKAFRWGIPVFVVMVLFPLVYSVCAKFALGDEFLSVFVGNLCLLLAYNLADLIIVDWLVICLITPKFFVVPGTEGDPGYKDYGFHLRGFFKGLGFVVVGSLVFSGLAELMYVVWVSFAPPNP